MPSKHQVTTGSYHDAPPLAYVGGKWKLADWVISFFPKHTTYVEPFCGGASIFMRKPPSKIEVINDLDQRLVNFFEVMRDASDELIRLIDMTPYSEYEYQKALRVSPDPLEDARRLYVGLWQTYGNTTLYRSGWSWEKTWARGKTLPESWDRKEGLELAAKRLKNAQIACAPAIEIIERYDTPETLFYVDPPYVYKSRSSPRRRYWHEMDNKQHHELAEVLNNVKGQVLLSGYDSELYDTLYPNWTTYRKQSRTNGHTSGLEVLWASPNLEYLPMFKFIGENNAKSTT